ncbi:MAG: hypothetical protein Q8L73_02635 [Methylotenera sp.]|nr:hypothetical protein [Methylotenera sp.]
MKYRLPLAMLGAMLVASSAHAVDADCQAIIDAGRAKLRAPMVHDINVLDAKAGTTTEFIKINQNIWLKVDRGWKKMPLAVLTTMQKVSMDGITMSDCRQAGSERVGLIPTRIYSWSTSMGGKSYGNARVWVGSDGLPYKQTSGNANSTTTYTGVVAPKVGQ